MATAKILGLTSGFKFQPDDDEVIEYFLVPRLRGQPLPLEDIVFDADPLSAPPWELLKRNGRGEEDDAYFFAQGEAAKSRKVRACGNYRTWVGQKTDKTGKLRVGEEIFAWQKYRFNFHDGKGKSGSTGWVMLEYSVVAPDDCAAFKVCRISFTGHGQKRKRVPDGYAYKDSAATHRQIQVAATSSTDTCCQDHNGAHAYHQDQDHFLMQPQDAGVEIYHDQEHFLMQPQSYNHAAGVDGVTGPMIYQDQDHFLMQPQDAGVDGVTGPLIYQYQEPLAMITQQQFVDQELGNRGSFNSPTMDHGMMPLHMMDQETRASEQRVDNGTMLPPIHHDSYYMPEQSVEYGCGTMPPPMGQGSGVPPQQFFLDDDPMLQQVLESMGDFATAAQADPSFGDHWGSAGQGYHHHRHVLPE